MRRASPLIRFLAAAGLLILTAATLIAQEALRMSAAGEQAAEERRRANDLPNYYNLKLGDFQLRLQSSLGLEFNDNVSLVDTNAESDFILRPELNTTASYPLSQQNTLNLRIGAGYSYYLNNSELNQFFIRPGTELSFDIFIKDVVINLHDRISIVNQGYQNSLTGTRDYSYLENVAGLTGTWDLNKVQVSGSYDHLQRISLTSDSDSGGSQLDATQDIFSGSVAVILNPYSLVGIQASMALIEYEQSTLQGGVQYSAGLFYKLQLSQYLSGRASAGYFIYLLDVPDTITSGTNVIALTNVNDRIDAFYGSIALDHRVNPRLRYSLEAGRQVQAGLFSNTLDLYYARIRANWGIVRKLPITTSFSYENGSESGGLGEKIERFGFGIGCSRVITKKLSSSLHYNHWVRTSDSPNRSYTQNRVLLSFTYSF